MKVALDAQLTLGTATGIGEYVSGLAEALRLHGTDVVELGEPRLDPWRFDRRVAWDQAVLPLRARNSGADLLHCASGTMPWSLPLPAVVTVHDVAWLKAQRHAPWYARYYFGPFALQRYRRAGAIAVDSAFSRNELLRVLDIPRDRVEVIYPGVASEFLKLRRVSSSDAVLVPGTVERRKNFEVLIRALPMIGPRVRIVSIGPFTPYREELLELARSLGVSERVEFRGYVSRAVLLDLYARCALVAVPSRYEGFGYAAAQALCAGVPVLVSDQASLPEIAGRSATIVPVGDAAAWALEITRILSDPATAGERSERLRTAAIEQFSWDTAAAKMQRLYEKVMSRT